MHLRVALAVLLSCGLLLAGCISDPDPVVAPGTPAPATSDSNTTGPWTGDDRAIGVQDIELIFGGSIRQAETWVLLVPPTHGDVGSPLGGPSLQDYLDATLRGLKNWEPMIDRFIADHPEYAYLDAVRVEVEVFDGVSPQRAGYDVVVGYIETSGPAFRGVATQGVVQPQEALERAGLADLVHYGDRYILLSLFASAPRGGQEIPDWPEVNDLESVTMHEFAHTWGLGHTTTWTERYGPDLMNSPYPLVYGDGDPAGDGGERTHLLCTSSLDLYGLAHLYRWLPDGVWEGSSGTVASPLEYTWYCPDYASPPAWA